MNDKAKIMANATYALTQYGINASVNNVEIIDIGLSNVSLLINKGEMTYLVIADDHLLEDESYVSQATSRGLGKLTPLKLLKPSPDGKYVTMFDHVMACKVYETQVINE